MKTKVIQKNQSSWIQKSSYSIIGGFLVLAIIGYFLIPQLNVRLNPSRSLPSISVSYGYAGANPKTIDLEVTSPLEASLSRIDRIKTINSTSSKGNGRITIEFEKNTDLDFLRFEVSSKIRQTYPNLPEGVSYPRIRINQPDDDRNRGPFLIYTINAPEGSNAIQEFAENFIKPEIASINGVSNTTVYGGAKLEYLIEYDINQLNQFKLSKSDLISTLTKHFDEENLGYARIGEEQIEVSIASNSSEHIWHIPVTKVGNRIIYFTDLCTIQLKEQQPYSYFRINGENAIRLAIEAEKGTNTIELAKQVHKHIQNLSEQSPAGYQIMKSYDATEYVNDELNKIKNRTALTIAILLVFILLFTLSFRYLLIVVSSLAVNIGIAIILYYLFKVEIQLYSLAGITISLGLIIDNSIVMIDHIKKTRNTNSFIPILAATLTTIGALSVIYFLDDQLKLNLIDFALVIVINLSVSLAIALFFIPAFLFRFSFQEKKQSNGVARLFDRITNSLYQFYERFILFLLRIKYLVLLVFILSFGIPFFMLPKQWEVKNELGEVEKTWYTTTYNNTFGSNWYNNKARPIIDKVTGGSFRLFKLFVYEGSYYGKNEETKLNVSAEADELIPLEQFNETILELENFLLQFDEIEQFVTTVYPEYGNIEIRFKEEYRDSGFPFLLKARLIRNAIDLGGVEWNVYGVGKGFNNPKNAGEIANYTVQMSGYNYDELTRLADEFADSLLTHPRLQKAQITTNEYSSFSRDTEFLLALNREELALYQLSANSVLDALKEQSINNTINGYLPIDNQQMAIRLQDKHATSFDQWAVQNDKIIVNKQIRGIQDVVDFSERIAEDRVRRKNQEYIVYIKAQYTGSYRFGNKYIDQSILDFTPNLPIGYNLQKRDNIYFFGDKNKNYTYLLLLVALIIYFITSVLFNQLKQGFIILAIIPVSFIGVFLTFYLFDYNFDQGGLASFLLLAGLTVNAALFILDEYNHLKKLHTNKLTAYLSAVRKKLFPILLTILSTSLGFIPFLIEGQNEVFWFALCVATIGGLLLSIIGLFLLLPVLVIWRKRK